MTITVAKLIEVLNAVEDKNIPVRFSYDSRVCCCDVTCVDLTNGEQDRRVTAADFLEGCESNANKPVQEIVLRDEDEDQYSWQLKNYPEDYREDINLYLEVDEEAEDG